MYATIEHRRTNPASLGETVARGEREFLPQLGRAPGFVGFYVVAQENGENAAIALWESRAHAEAFEAETAGWLRTLEELGHDLQGQHGGEVIAQLAPRP